MISVLRVSKMFQYITLGPKAHNQHYKSIKMQRLKKIHKILWNFLHINSP